MERNTTSNKRNDFNEFVYSESSRKRSPTLEKEMEEDLEIPEWIKILKQLKAKALR